MAAGEFSKLVTSDGTALFVATNTLPPARSTPDAPTVGDLWWDSSTGGLMEYQSSTTGWTPPWNTAWGEPSGGYAEITSNSSTFTTIADVSGLSVTWTAVANRIYVVEFDGLVNSSVAADRIRIHIADSSNATKKFKDWPVGTTSNYAASSRWRVSGLSAGSVTYKIRGERVSGTGNCQIGAGATAPAFIRVDDVGPSAAPA